MRRHQRNAICKVTTNVLYLRELIFPPPHPILHLFTQPIQMQ